jgi:hypothetical protein
MFGKLLWNPLEKARASTRLAPSLSGDLVRSRAQYRLRRQEVLRAPSQHKTGAFPFKQSRARDRLTWQEAQRAPSPRLTVNCQTEDALATSHTSHGSE